MNQCSNLDGDYLPVVSKYEKLRKTALPYSYLPSEDSEDAIILTRTRNAVEHVIARLPVSDLRAQLADGKEHCRIMTQWESNARKHCTEPTTCEYRNVKNNAQLTSLFANSNRRMTKLRVLKMPVRIPDIGGLLVIEVLYNEATDDYIVLQFGAESSGASSNYKPTINKALLLSDCVDRSHPLGTLNVPAREGDRQGFRPYRHTARDFLTRHLDLSRDAFQSMLKEASRQQKAHDAIVDFTSVPLSPASSKRHREEDAEEDARKKPRL